MTLQTRVVTDDKERLEFLPKYFGPAFMLVESTVYSYARRAIASYPGGYWEFVETSNGGGYMRPTDLALGIDNKIELGNIGKFGGHERMSEDAAGLALTIIVVNHLWHRDPHNKKLEDAYYALMGAVPEHPEAAALYSWLD